MSIDLVPLWAAEWTESDKHIKLIGLMTIRMKKNNSDQTKGKPWTESVKLIRISFSQLLSLMIIISSQFQSNCYNYMSLNEKGREK